MPRLGRAVSVSDCGRLAPFSCSPPLRNAAGEASCHFCPPLQLRDTTAVRHFCGSMSKLWAASVT